MVDYENRSYTTITDTKDNSRVKNILNHIPEDVGTIIDIGCGNGLVTNELGKIYKVLGVDINESKLKFVATEKIQSSCDNIERPDNSFDLVFSSEMLEHLDDQLFHDALDEFNRLSKKYILITVPNREPLYKVLVKCRHCGNTYHKNGHLRNFHEERLNDLHPNWKLVEGFEFGKKVRYYHKALADLKHKWTPPSAWIPNYWIKNQGVTTNFCTTCGEKNKLDYKFNALAFLIDSLNLITTRKNKSHLLALFEKKNNM